MYIYQGADLIIALTHMRWPNDRLLAERVPGLDIILAGHDHDYGLEIVSLMVFGYNSPLLFDGQMENRLREIYY